MSEIQTKPNRVRVTASLSREVFDALKQMADDRGVSMVDELRNAIGTLRFLRGEVRKGARIVLESPDGSMREVRLR